MYDGIDEIVSDLGRKWKIPHFEKRYEKREYRKSAMPKEAKKKSIPQKTKVIRDQTLMSLKYPASRAVSRLIFQTMQSEIIWLRNRPVLFSALSR